MREYFRRPVFILSISLNAAFITIWLAQVLPGLLAAPDRTAPVNFSALPPVHQALGVSSEQWKRIEPRLVRFQERAESQRRTLRTLRGQLLELLAAAPVDKDALRKKQEEILAGRRLMQNMVIEYLLEEKEVLTSKQQKILFDLICARCEYGENNDGVSGLGRAVSEENLPLRPAAENKNSGGP